MNKEKQIREEWHQYFIRNKNRFTDSKKKSLMDTRLIYVPKELHIAFGVGGLETLENNFWTDNENDNISKINEGT